VYDEALGISNFKYGFGFVEEIFWGQDPLEGPFSRRPQRQLFSTAYVLLEPPRGSDSFRRGPLSNGRRGEASVMMRRRRAAEADAEAAPVCCGACVGAEGRFNYEVSDSA
jgi:hypothetical protein